jgi:hypothetical protein
VVKEGVDAISKFPPWAQLLIALYLITLIYNDKTREVIIDIFRYLIQVIINILKWFYTTIKETVILLEPYIDITILGTQFFLDKIKETIIIHQQLNLQRS